MLSQQPAWQKLKLLPGGQGHALARRLRRLGSQTREKLASVELCLEGEQWGLAHVLPSPLVSCVARVLGSSC